MEKNFIFFKVHWFSLGNLVSNYDFNTWMSKKMVIKNHDLFWMAFRKCPHSWFRYCDQFYHDGLLNKTYQKWKWYSGVSTFDSKDWKKGKCNGELSILASSGK